MKKLKGYLSTLIMLAGLLIAAMTGNIGNIFIFAGLYLVYLSATHDAKKDYPIYKYTGVLIYAGGLAWAISLNALPLTLGWGSVFLTLIITTVGD